MAELSAKLRDLQDDIDALQDKGENVGLLAVNGATFNGLSAAVATLYVALVERCSSRFTTWCSRTGWDGAALPDGFMLLGINTRKGTQVSLLVPDSYFDICKKFVDRTKINFEYDGHTNADVFERIALRR